MTWTWLLVIGIAGVTALQVIREIRQAKVARKKEDESWRAHNYRTWAPYLNLPAEWIPGNSAFEVRSYYASKHQISISDVVALRYDGDRWRSSLK